ncbi:MAG: saccharopine dehydrogenase NADP-binding domain-containing protein [Ignisphaera sp.]
MKIVVIGVGTIGKVIIRDLLERWKVDEIIAVDYNFKELEKFVSSLNDPRVKPLKGDIRNIDEIAEIMKKGDVVVNSTWYEFNIHAIKAMLKAKRDMIDLGGLYWMTKKELEWDEEVRKAGLTLITGAGDDPGTSNILARYCADKLDEVREIHIRWGGKVLREEDKALFGFSVLTALDEITMNAVIYRDGKYVEVPPLSEKEITYFPEPIGYQYTYAIIHSELATLPWTIRGVRTVTYKDTWDERVFPIISFIKESGLALKEFVDVMGQKVSPAHLLASLIRPWEPESYVGALKVVVIGVEKGVEVRYTYYLGPVGYKKEWGAGCTAITTAYGATAALRLLVDQHVSKKGVIPPELVDRPDQWLRELKERNLPLVEIKEEIRSL